MVTLSHDAFARRELVREVVVDWHSCQWCGGHRAKSPDKLFRYGTSLDDSAIVFWDTRHFCSVDCRRAYYDGA
jgi:hypothetical protein